MNEQDPFRLAICGTDDLARPGDPRAPGRSVSHQRRAQRDERELAAVVGGIVCDLKRDSRGVWYTSLCW